MTERIKNFEKLKDYLPLPLGWLVLIIVFLLYLGAGFAIANALTLLISLLINVYQKIDNQAGYLILATTNFIFLPLSLLAFIFYSNTLSRYISRNIKGYKLWCRLEDGKVIYIVTDFRAEKPAVTDLPNIGIAIGGWFNKHVTPEDWRIKKFGIEEWAKGMCEHAIWITIQDFGGNKISLSINTALYLIERHPTDKCPLLFSSIIKDFESMETRLKRIVNNQEVDIERRESESYNLKLEIDKLILLFYSIIKRIKETKRFRYSEEGRKIRLDGTRNLLQFLKNSRHDPMRVELEQDLKDEEQKQNKKKYKTA